jgi:putative pyruvate formate lyase activating enzyme
MNRIYRAGGEIVLIDPTPDMLPLIKKMNPRFKIASRPPKRYEPLFVKSKRTGELDERLRKAEESLRSCKLCAWECGADRAKEKGVCRASSTALCYPPFIHIAEESVINPALILNFAFCSLDCVYCIAKEKNESVPSVLSGEAFWNQAEALFKSFPFQTIEFGGGEPSLFIPSILSLLKTSPPELSLPIVLNSNLFLSPQAVELCDGIVDVYLVDFRYAGKKCAERLSKAPNYFEAAWKALESLAKQKAKIIVRILVIPNHFECCHKSVIEKLSKLRERIWISVLDQYVPAHLALCFPDIARRPNRKEVEEVKRLAESLGLRDVEEKPEAFWIE